MAEKPQNPDFWSGNTLRAAILALTASITADPAAAERTTTKVDLSGTIAAAKAGMDRAQQGMDRAQQGMNRANMKETSAAGDIMREFADYYKEEYAKKGYAISDEVAMQLAAKEFQRRYGENR